MNSSEIKLDLFRKIDSLDNRELEKIYTNLIDLLNTVSSDQTPSMSPELKAALDEALEASKIGQTYSHEEVMQMTKEKYVHLGTPSYTKAILPVSQ